MILTNSQEVELERSEGIETKAFSFDEGSIGLMINAFLRYSNPIGAMIRELVSNAYDANKEAGSDKPVIVALEYKDNGYTFIVQDSGLGMSKTILENIYIKFGASTKRNSNDYIGAYGLGSKSPLGYADYFICETVSSGIKNTLVITKTGNIPDANFVDESFTNEVSGTKISVPIKKQDYVVFQTEIKSQLRYFDNVVFLGDINVESDIIKSKDFISNVKFTSVSSSLHICMGKVYYPIRNDIIFNEEFNKRPDANQIKKLINSNIGLYFDIGELDVVWNREDISYDSSNIQKIQNKILSVFDSVGELISVALSKGDKAELLYLAAFKLEYTNYRSSDAPENVKQILKLVKNPMDFYQEDPYLLDCVKYYLEHTIKRQYCYIHKNKLSIINSDLESYLSSSYCIDKYLSEKDIRDYCKYTGNSIVLNETNKKELQKRLEENPNFTKGFVELYNKHLPFSDDTEEQIIANVAASEKTFTDVLAYYLKRIDYYGRLVTNPKDHIPEVVHEKVILTYDAANDFEQKFKATRIEYEYAVQHLAIKYEENTINYLVIGTLEHKKLAYKIYEAFKSIYDSAHSICVSLNTYYRILEDDRLSRFTIINMEQALKLLERRLKRQQYYNNNYEKINKIRYCCTSIAQNRDVYNIDKSVTKKLRKIRDEFNYAYNTDQLALSLNYILSNYVSDLDTYVLSEDIHYLNKVCDFVSEFSNKFVSEVPKIKKEWADKIVHTELNVNLQISYFKKHGCYKIFKD